MKRTCRMASGAIALLAAAAVISPTQAQDKSQAPAQQKPQPAAEKKAQPQAQQKPQPQAQAKAPTPAAPKKTAAKSPGKLEKLTCMRGTEDEHARIAVEVIGGKVQSFAYYSKKKPRTCSVHVQRDDAYSRWSEEGRFIKVATDNGDFLIENRPRDVKFLFRDVDRMHYCGMDMGKINGTLTVTRGKRECSIEQLMDAHREEAEAAVPEAVPQGAEQKQAPRS